MGCANRRGKREGGRGRHTKVSGPDRPRGTPVAVLGAREAASSHHDACRGRDIESVHAVSAGSDNVDDEAALLAHHTGIRKAPHRIGARAKHGRIELRGLHGEAACRQISLCPSPTGHFRLTSRQEAALVSAVRHAYDQLNGADASLQEDQPRRERMDVPSCWGWLVPPPVARHFREGNYSACVECIGSPPGAPRGKLPSASGGLSLPSSP